MQMGGTLAEHLQKVSIPTPAMLYLVRTWGFEMLLRLPLSVYYAFVSRTWGWWKPRSLSCRAAEPHVEGPVPGMVRWLPSSPCESSFLSFRTFPSASQPFWGCPCQGRPSVFLGVKTSSRRSLSRTKRLFLASSWSAGQWGAVHVPHENLRPTPTGEGGREEGRERGTLNKAKLPAVYWLAKRKAVCCGHREQPWVSCVPPWSSPWRAGGSSGRPPCAWRTLGVLLP